jgi:hypothetical protein
MRRRFKIILLVGLFTLLTVTAYFARGNPATKTPPPTRKVAAVKLAPCPTPTATWPLPGPKPDDESTAQNTDPDTASLRNLSANISNRLLDFDFDTVATYTQPGTEGETKEMLERLLRGPDGIKRIQMLARAFDAFQYQDSYKHPGEEDAAFFRDKTIYSTAASSPLLLPLTPGEREVVTTIPVKFVKVNNQWYLFDQFFGLLVNASCSTPLPAVVPVDPIPDK